MNKHCLQYDEYNQLFDFYRKSIFKDFFYSSENCVYSRILYRIKMCAWTYPALLTSLTIIATFTL